jgi:two-component system cell cycle response regulator
VLVDGQAQRGADVVGRCATALAVEDGGLAIGNCHGLVVIPAEAQSASEALRIADRRMYAQKEARPGSAQRQARDVLLEVVSEREPELRDHVHEVADLATAVGRRLGMDAAELSDLARAAELHDIGKLALPDELLRKPGPLDEREWEVMYEHTIIGERMLNAASSLKRVATYVRASHERWDGRGYPDGLTGEEIPLASRIEAVCDAYHAMRADRAYRPSLSALAAVAELQRCAGRQFDPRVVDALVQAIRPESAPASSGEPRARRGRRRAAKAAAARAG